MAEFLIGFISAPAPFELAVRRSCRDTRSAFFRRTCFAMGIHRRFKRRLPDRVTEKKPTGGFISRVFLEAFLVGGRDAASRLVPFLRSL